MRIFEGTTGDYKTEIQKLRHAFYSADAVLVGAGAGLSTSAGLNYAGERLHRFFGDFVNKYDMPNIGQVIDDLL